MIELLVIASLLLLFVGMPAFLIVMAFKQARWSKEKRELRVRVSEAHPVGSRVSTSAGDGVVVKVMPLNVKVRLDSGKVAYPLLHAVTDPIDRSDT